MTYNIVRNGLLLLLILLVTFANCVRNTRARTQRVNHLVHITKKNDNTDDHTRKKRIDDNDQQFIRSRISNASNIRTKRIELRHEQPIANNNIPLEIKKNTEVPPKRITTHNNDLKKVVESTLIHYTEKHIEIPAKTTELTTTTEVTRNDIENNSNNINDHHFERKTTTMDQQQQQQQQQQQYENERGYENDHDNNIHDFKESIHGTCHGRKLNQTFSQQDCDDVTVESLACEGVCAVIAQPFSNYFDDLEEYDQCTFCGPTEYEKKFIFFQCYSGTTKRRRWKLEVKEIQIPKHCGCLKDSCHKLNAVSQEQYEQNAFFK